jgi:YD repeat-containing protein
MKAIDFPVDYSKGTVNVDIPIYTLRNKDIEVPISLSYNSGQGFKVEELDTDVGLGWNLSGYGLITQSVVGLRDFFDGSSGFESKNSVFSFVDQDVNIISGGGYLLWNGENYYLNVSEKPLNQDQVFNGYKDGEPDIFYFSYPGGSGKFYIDKSGNFVEISPTKTKIVMLNDSTFELTDTRGMVYTFVSRESVRTQSSCLSASIYSSYRQLDEFSPNFHLIRITSPQGGNVNYVYETIQYSYQTNLSQTSHSKVSPIGSPKGLSQCYQTVTVVSAQRIKKIVGDNTFEVNFIYSSPTEKSPLQQIEIRHEGQAFKKFLLVSERVYGNNVTGANLPTNLLNEGNTSHLMLKAVGEEGVPSFKFEYNSSLPQRFSYARDHWGMYNGKHTNPSLIPAGTSLGVSMGDADRSFSSAHATAGLLSKVTYPTGGSQIFTYEPNSKPKKITMINGCAIVTVRKTLAVVCEGDEIKERQFSAGPNTSNFWVSYSTNSPNTDQITPVTNTPFSQALIENVLVFQGNSLEAPLTLSPGTYQIKVWTANFLSQLDEQQQQIPVKTRVTISWDEQETICDVVDPELLESKIGGVRLKSVRTENLSDGKNMQTDYRYAGSNVNNLFVFDNYSYTSFDPASNAGNPTCTPDPYFSSSGDAYAVYHTRSSSSMLPLQFQSGAIVLYDTVTITSYALQSKNVLQNLNSPRLPNGKTIRYYKHYPNEKLFRSSIYAESDFSFLSSELIKEEFFEFQVATQSFNKQLTKEFYYSVFPASNVVWGFKAARTHSPYLKVVGYSSGLPLCQGAVPKYEYVYYSLGSIRRNLNKVVTTEHHNTNQFVTEEFYEYGALHHQLVRHSRKTTKKSGDEFLGEITKRFIYADEAGADPVYQSMINRNFWTPIYQYEIKSGMSNLTSSPSLVQVQKILFSNAQSLIRPIGVLNSTLANPVSTGAIFSAGSLDPIVSAGVAEAFKYNSNGNIIEVEKLGQKSAFVWDETGSNLIAAFENCGSDEIYFTSFENSLGTTGLSKTGNKHFAGTSLTIPFPVSPGLKLSYWYWHAGSSTWKFSGQLNYTTTVVSLLSPIIDELMIIPSRPISMQSFGYLPGGYIKSKTDINGTTTYFEYDDLERLKAVFDNKKDLIGSYSYKFRVNQN